MATIEVRCKVRLSEAIVLATQQDTSYPAIRWPLANGDTVSVEMEVPEQQIGHSYQEHSSQGNWYVNSIVDLLKVSVRVESVSADDLDRLYVRHASASTFKAHFKTNSGPLDQTYQEALELGRRVVKEIREAVNLVLRFIRNNYGQHRLRPLSDDGEEHLQNFLDAVRAEWARRH